MKIFLIPFLLLSYLLMAGHDLEEFAQDFVLETKKIEVAGYPHAFNPSIVSWQGRLLMSFRVLNDSSAASPISSAGDSCIGLVWLDEEFNPKGKPQLLPLKSSKKADMQSEDARLLAIEDKLYLIYSGNGNKIIDDEGFRMYVSELKFNGKSFSVLKSECLSEFEGRNKNRREKNWVPFAYENELYLAYSIKPHRILQPLLDGSKTCLSKYISWPSIVWEWGELRGGTPALPIDENHYLSFFHSACTMASAHSNFEMIPHYFIGGYLFNRSPPFTITHVSPEPITGKGFYEGNSYVPYWHPVQVVFPCGFVFNDNFIWITIGRQDHEVWVVKLDKQEFLDSLIQVSSLSK